ncbi:MAG: hypothetical protein MUP81_03315 [Dehalococcoidia bacterium]|nr:hypothetical protein [Dehalococcoidia bacterium]
MAKFKPPTLQEMLDYQRANPELSNLDVPYLHNAYTKSDWEDTRGNKVKGWKMKLWTLSRMESNYNPPKLCYIESCRKPAIKWRMQNGKKIYICDEHLPKESPPRPAPVPSKTNEQTFNDKRRDALKLIQDLGDKMKG